jgi:hypothetical protein
MFKALAMAYPTAAEQDFPLLTLVIVTLDIPVIFAISTTVMRLRAISVINLILSSFIIILLSETFITVITE